MKTLILYTFSGTGNTRFVAERITKNFLSAGWNVDSRDVEELLKGGKKTGEIQADLIGIGCPVIGFGVPLAVRKAVRKLPAVTGIPAFVFRTAGGVAPVNYRASKPLIRSLQAKGYKVFHERLFSISSNWIRAFDPSAVARLIAATERKIDLMCTELREEKPRMLETGFWLGLGLEILMKAEAPMMRTFGPDFRVSDECSRCRQCVKNCPMTNIAEKKGRLRFGLECTSCLRCLYSCPQNAISLKRLASMPIPGGYNFAKTLAGARSSQNAVPGYIPPFLAGYEADDAL